VRKTRGPRPPRDPDAERLAIESRTLDEWIDEGSLRDEATDAAGRARRVPPKRRPRTTAGHVDTETSAQIRARAPDDRRASHIVERLAQAQDALERERFDDARRIATPLLRSVPQVPAVHEVIGLAAYRSGRWKQAVTELEAAQSLRPTVELLPVLADGYRALRRWGEVERIWSEVRAMSPAQEILAEARIVAAGAQADQGDLQGALRTMARAKQSPRRVRDHHLRQWYVLADLYDRAGDPLEATRWFELVARHDPEFVDVAERLQSLGR
jgi:tetratricopeptide (TPR) repeat protein